MLLFCAKTIMRGSHSIELARLKTEERRWNWFWQFGNFLVQYFCYAF